MESQIRLLVTGVVRGGALVNPDAARQVATVALGEQHRDAVEQLLMIIQRIRRPR